MSGPSALLLLAALQGAPCNPGGSQMEMNACAADAFERADAALNRLWREVVADAQQAAREIDRSHDTRPTSEAVIRDAQRAWITFRDGQCTYEAYADRGGSIEPLVYDECRARLTRERIAQLSPQPAPDQ